MADNISKTVTKEIAIIGDKVIDNLDQVTSGIGGVIKNTSGALRGDLGGMGKNLSKSIGGKISKTSKGLRDDLGKIAGQIGGHISDVIGPEITSIMKTIGGVGKNLAKSLFSFGSKESKSEKKRNSLLQNIVNHFKDEKKRIARGLFDKVDGGFFEKIID